MKFQKASSKDFGKVAELFYEYDKYENSLNKTHEIASLKDALIQIKEMSKKGIEFFIIKDKEILGAAAISVDRRGKFKHGVIHTLIISEKSRGKGLGKLFVQEIFNYLKKKECTRVRTFILNNNKQAQEFWKKQMFRLEAGYNASRKL